MRRHTLINAYLDDIHVFYIPMALLGRGNVPADGVGLDHIYAPQNPGYQYNVFIEKRAYPYGLAHELGHILTDGGHFGPMEAVGMPNPGIYRTNLMYDVLPFDGSFTDGKRLIESQKSTIQGSRHAKPIVP